MAEAMGCESSYLTKLLKPGAHKVGPSLLVNLVKRVHEIAGQRHEDVTWLTPGWVQYGGPKAGAAGTLREEATTYRVNPDLALIFKTQTYEQLVNILSGVLLDKGAAAPARAHQAELVFGEIRRRLRSSSAPASGAEELLDAAEEEVDRAPESARSAAAGETSAAAAPPPRAVSPDSTGPPGAPKPVRE